MIVFSFSLFSIENKKFFFLLIGELIKISFKKFFLLILTLLLLKIFFFFLFIYFKIL
jgi:hypothetical protein